MPVIWYTLYRPASRSAHQPVHCPPMGTTSLTSTRPDSPSTTAACTSRSANSASTSGSDNGSDPPAGTPSQTGARPTISVEQSLLRPTASSCSDRSGSTWGRVQAAFLVLAQRLLVYPAAVWNGLTLPATQYLCRYPTNSTTL